MVEPVRPLVVIAGAEALAGVGLSLLVIVGSFGSELDGGIAVATVVMWLVIVAALGLIWFGLFRRRRAAHTPFVLAQLFALVLAWPLVSSDVAIDRAAGVLLALAAVVGLVLGLRPAVRASLA